MSDPSSSHQHRMSEFDLLASSSQTYYVAITSPPTPAPSPGPYGRSEASRNRGGAPYSPSIPLGYSIPPHDSAARRQFLYDVLKSCSPSELLYISTSIAPRLKRDFLYCLPPEVAIHILGFIDDPCTLGRVAQVSKHWNRLVHDEYVWKRMCIWNGFDDFPEDELEERKRTQSITSPLTWVPSPIGRTMSDRVHDREPNYAQTMTYVKPKLSSNYQHFKLSYMTMMNWRRGGSLLRSHRMPVVTPDSGVITSLAIDKDWVVVGLANSRIHVFSAETGVMHKTLVGHESGVWGVCLVSRGGHLATPPCQEKELRAPGSRKNTNPRIHRLNTRLATLDIDGSGSSLEHTLPSALRFALGLGSDEDARASPRTSNRAVPLSNPICTGGDQSYASKGWGQPNPLVVSGGCDKVLRVWDLESGLCIYQLTGHTSTIRCIRVLDNRPIAVTGSRDATLRVWDIQRGKMLRVLEGHTQSVRCLDVHGNKVVSGSYDNTCRLWDIDTGECLQVLRGHLHQIYSVAFDGVRIASGGLDTSVRLWDANTGQCQAILQGHTALVCQLQLSSTLLATGGSDGRVITFSLSNNAILHRIAAHDSSVTSLQFDNNFLVTGGNDGRVRLFETQTGNHVRELSDPSDSVWKVACGKETCAVMCKRAGNTVMEIWSMKPKET